MAISKKKKSLFLTVLAVLGIAVAMTWNRGNGVKLKSKPWFLPFGFDPAGYLKFNPDVAAAGGPYANDPAGHYMTYGWMEGRRWR